MTMHSASLELSEDSRRHEASAALTPSCSETHDAVRPALLSGHPARPPLFLLSPVCILAFPEAAPPKPPTWQVKSTGHDESSEFQSISHPPWPGIRGQLTQNHPEDGGTGIAMGLLFTECYTRLFSALHALIFSNSLNDSMVQT